VAVVVGLVLLKMFTDRHFFDGYVPPKQLELRTQVLENTRHNGHRLEKVQIKAIEGVDVPMLFHFPEDVKLPVPCVVLLYGIGQDMSFVSEIASDFTSKASLFCVLSSTEEEEECLRFPRCDTSWDSVFSCTKLFKHSAAISECSVRIFSNANKKET